MGVYRRRMRGAIQAAGCGRRGRLWSGLVALGRVVEGGFRPGGVHREWCDVEVLRTIRRKSLWRGCGRKWRRSSSALLARLLTRWQGVVQPRKGLDALLDAIENLQARRCRLRFLRRRFCRPASPDTVRPISIR